MAQYNGNAMHRMNGMKKMQAGGMSHFYSPYEHVVNDCLDTIENSSKEINMALYKRKMYHEKRKKRLEEHVKAKNKPIQEAKDKISDQSIENKNDFLNYYLEVKKGIKSCDTILENLTKLENLLQQNQ